MSAPIRRLALDVDKVIDRPEMVEFARALADVPGVSVINSTVNEIDIETVGTIVTFKGEDIDQCALRRDREGRRGPAQHRRSGCRRLDHRPHAPPSLNAQTPASPQGSGLVAGAGSTDGILNALTLAAGAILRSSDDGLSVTLTGRVGAASCVTAAFTMFVADSAERRSRRVRASKDRTGTLGRQQPGTRGCPRAAPGAGLAAVLSLVRAASPLLMGTLPHVSLSPLGRARGHDPPARCAWLAHRHHALECGLHWAIAMLLGGVSVTFTGAWLNIA